MIVVVLCVTSLLLLIGVLIWGLWIHNQVDQFTNLASSVNFYKSLTIGSSHSTTINLALIVVQK